MQIIKVVDALDTRDRHYTLRYVYTDTAEGALYYAYYFDYRRKEYREFIRRRISAEMDTPLYQDNITHIFNIRVKNIEKDLRNGTNKD